MFFAISREKILQSIVNKFSSTLIEKFLIAYSGPDRRDVQL